MSRVALTLLIFVLLDLNAQGQSSLTIELDSRIRSAESAEKAGLTEQALNDYALALNSDARYEPAHFGRSNLLFRMGRRKEAYDAVTAGLEAAPTSARLHVIKIDLLEQDDRIFDMREAVRIAAEAAPDDEKILRRLAQVSDVFGSHAGEAYERWAAALERDGMGADAVKHALQRGMVVALRDGEQEAARRITDRLGLTRVPPVKKEVEVLWIPGGVQGMAVAVGLDPEIPPPRFLTEYARAILKTAGRLREPYKSMAERVRLYLETVKELKAYALNDGARSEIVLDVQTAQGLDRTRKILELLGWRLTPSKNGFIVELRSEPEAAARQSFAASLSIDEVEMKSNLEEKKPYRFEIADEPAPMIFSEAYWFASILKKDARGRSFLLEMLENLPACRLYAGLASMSDETQHAIFTAVAPEQLLAKATALSIFGSSITIEKGRLVLPGGDEAQPSWSELAGVSPLSAGAFIGTLISKDGGKLLAYYCSLASLPRQNQRFFTGTTKRIFDFYKAFPFLNAISLEAGSFYLQDDPFTRLARELPLTNDGRVRFPGSERVWISDGVPPDDDAEALLKMLKQKYAAGPRHIRRIETFLAVARIESHRKEPMDELMARTLSRNYGKYRALFPYFAELPTLSGPAVLEFFLAAQRLEQFKGKELNTALGEFHGLIKLIVMLRGAGGLADSKAVELLQATCSSLAGIRAYPEIGRTAFKAVERILSEAGYDRSAPADDLLVEAFAGSSKLRAERIREVLRRQSITPLEDLLDIYRTAADERIEQLNLDLKNTIVGWIYALHFSPRDLAVATDKNFSRRHAFFSLEVFNAWPETRVGGNSASSGARLIGGLAQMADAAGTLAMAQVESSESVIAGVAERTTALQLASIRSVPWNRVSQRSMHLAGLKMRVAREVIVQSAWDSNLRKELMNATIGLIGPRRRFELMQSLEEFDLRRAIRQFSSSDLVFLADVLQTSGPVAAALEHESAIVPSEEVHYFGGYHAFTYGCTHPHLISLRPYEDFENQLRTEAIAERLSHILLSLAEAADREGLPVDAVTLLAEAAVQQLTTLSRMFTYSDWSAAIEAMDRIDLNLLLPLLEKN